MCICMIYVYITYTLCIIYVYITGTVYISSGEHLGRGDLIYTGYDIGGTSGVEGASALLIFSSCMHTRTHACTHACTHKAESKYIHKTCSH